MAQYPAASTTVNVAANKILVTKADTASSTSLGSATVSSDAGVVDTYGTWTQIIASTAAESYITALGITIPSSSTPTVSDGPLAIQLGIGAAASEVAKFEQLVPITTYTAKYCYIVKLDIPFRVTASKRIAARLKQAGSTTVTNLTVAVHGLPISQTEGN
jgi:hypothetical protein